MPPPDGHLPDPAHPEERRSVERRVENLERSYTHLQASLTKIETMQHATEQVLDSRHKALEKGQEIILVKVERLDERISIMAGDADKSPAGRAMLLRIDQLQTDYDMLAAQMQNIRDLRSEIRGGLALVKWLTSGAVITAILAALKAFGVIHP